MASGSSAAAVEADAPVDENCRGVHEEIVHLVIRHRRAHSNMNLVVYTTTRGAFFAFDPSWVHAAANDGDTDRYVLLLQPLRDDVRDEDVGAVAHYLDARVHPPASQGDYPFWLTRHGNAHATWLGFNESQVELAAGRYVSRRDAVLVYPAPDELGCFSPRGSHEWLAAPFTDAAATEDPLAAGAQIQPRYVGVDDAGGVDWIGVADGDVDADAVLRDPGLLRWVPQEAVDQVEVAPPKPAPRRKP